MNVGIYNKNTITDSELDNLMNYLSNLNPSELMIYTYEVSQNVIEKIASRINKRKIKTIDNILPFFKGIDLRCGLHNQSVCILTAEHFLNNTERLFKFNNQEFPSITIFEGKSITLLDLIFKDIKFIQEKDYEILEEESVQDQFVNWITNKKE